MLIDVRCGGAFATAVELGQVASIASSDLPLLYGQDFPEWERQWFQGMSCRGTGLSIFSGPTGTGKTSYLRHLVERLTAMDTHCFYYIPTSFAAVLTSPEFVNFWVAQHQYQKHRRKVAILEHAEDLLLKRDESSCSRVRVAAGEDESFGREAAAFLAWANELGLPPGERQDEILRGAESGGATDKTVGEGHSLEAAKKSHVSTENAFVNVGLVEDEEAEVLAESGDAGVVQVAHEPGVGDVRGHENDAAAEKDLVALGLGYAAVNEARLDAKGGQHPCPLAELVLDKGACGVKDKDIGFSVLEEFMHGGGHED